MKISNHFACLAGAVLLGTATPASAATAVFDFGDNPAGLNTTPNPDVYSLTSGGLTVTARAFSNIFQTVSYGSPVSVTHSANGLGVAGLLSDEMNLFLGFGEGLLLDFGQSVTLTQAVFGEWTALVDDVAFAVGNPLAPNTALSALPVNTWTGQWSGSFTGSQFFFAAKQDGTVDFDGFRLDRVSVSYTPAAAAPVPEPATWAMMILGFALVGAAMRRRQSRVAVRYNFA